jgi:hypothetical protein
MRTKFSGERLARCPPPRESSKVEPCTVAGNGQVHGGAGGGHCRKAAEDGKLPEREGKRSEIGARTATAMVCLFAGKHRCFGYTSAVTAPSVGRAECVKP